MKCKSVRTVFKNNKKSGRNVSGEKEKILFTFFDRGNDRLFSRLRLD